MSLADLTRNSFQSGISAARWVGLCKLFMSKNNTFHGLEDVQTALSNSVLVLYRSYPGDPALQDYLKFAIRDGMLSVSVFVATLLQAARSPDLHTPATLDMLCRVALDAHYSSGLPPIGSVVSYTESPIVVLGTIQDALALLRTAYSLPISHFHQLTTAASELVILLLSCVTDMSQVSTAQASLSFADANDMLHTLRLSPDVRQVLETFVMSLSLLIGDDAKAAREAQMMHTLQLTLGKGDILGPSSDRDTITFSLILQSLVSNRAREFGSGSGLDPVAILLGTLRWTSWTPSAYYTQLLLSAFTCMSQCGFSGVDSGAVLVWKSFIIGRLPYLLAMFEKAVPSDNSSEADWRVAMQIALTSLLQHSDVIAQCDRVTSHIGGADSMHEEFETPRSFLRDFVNQLLAVDLLDRPFAVSLDPGISNDNDPRVQSEAQEHGMDLDSYLDSKLSPEVGWEDTHALLRRIWRDAASHAVFSAVIWKRFTSLTSVLDVESLSHLGKILYSEEPVLDIISLHLKISDLVSHALLFLEEYDCETVGDPQTAVSHLGDIVMFVQSTLSRFHLPSTFKLGGQVLSAVYLRSTDDVQSSDSYHGDDRAAFNAWFKALFDSSSEGIEDTILRSTQPKTLLRISATLFSCAISACSEKKIDVDVLNNGVSYFLGPLLNWTLVGVVKALLREIQHKGISAQIHLEVLQTLILSPSCPRPVLSLCSPSIFRHFANPKGLNLGATGKIDVASIRKVVSQAVGLNDVATQDALFLGSHVAWTDQPRQATRQALACARAGKAPSFDIDRCLMFIPPSKFLQIFWSELSVAANMGEIEACRRIATFVLTMPRASKTPPLLPLFLHAVLPALLTSLDQQQPSEQTVSVELLVAVVSSAMTAALHLEWALHSVCNEQRVVLGQTSAAMARSLAGSLRARKHSSTTDIVAQRLGSSPQFVANFPVFMVDM